MKTLISAIAALTIATSAFAGSDSGRYSAASFEPSSAQQTSAPAQPASAPAQPTSAPSKSVGHYTNVLDASASSFSAANFGFSRD